MVEGGRFELPNPKERIYSPPRLATSLPLRHIWWRMTGSNRRPPACKAGALPAELILHFAWQRPTLTGTRSQLPSALESLTSVFGMGTGVTSSLSSLHNMRIVPSKLDNGTESVFFWLSPRSISIRQLHTSPCFHPGPIYLIVFEGSYLLTQWEISS